MSKSEMDYQMPIEIYCQLLYQNNVHCFLISTFPVYYQFVDTIVKRSCRSIQWNRSRCIDSNSFRILHFQCRSTINHNYFVMLHFPLIFFLSQKKKKEKREKQSTTKRQMCDNHRRKFILHSSLCYRRLSVLKESLEEVNDKTTELYNITTLHNNQSDNVQDSTTAPPPLFTP